MAKNIDEILNAILDIDTNVHLDRVIKTVTARREQLAGELALTLRIGDRIRIGRINKPRYMEGQTGVVAGPATGPRVPIRLDHPDAISPRYLQRDGTVHVPANLIELIARADDASSTGADTDGDAPARPSS
jgi:hypothetical protein